MRFDIALPFVFLLAAIPAASAQSAAPDTPNEWGQNTAAAAQAGDFGPTVSDIAMNGERGYADTRHDLSQWRSHPWPPGLGGMPVFDPEVGPETLLVPVGFY
jgi:hypothetical protein